MLNIFAIVVQQESGETEQNMGQSEQKYYLFSNRWQRQAYPLEFDI